MKKIILLLFSLPFIVLAQKKVDRVEMPTKDGSVFYEKIVELSPDLDKNTLFLRSLKWFANNFNDSKEVKQVEDKESGKIVGSGNFQTQKNFLTGGYDVVSFMVDITVKDGKYRAQFYDIQTKGVDSNGYSSYGYSPIDNKYNRQLEDNKYMFRGSDIKILRFIDEKINYLLESIKTDLSKHNASDDF